MKTVVDPNHPDLALLSPPPARGEEEADPAWRQLVVPEELTQDLAAEAARRQWTVEELTRYYQRVLYGHLLPDPGDVRLEAYIRTHHRLREWRRLYLRYHVRFVRCPRVLAKRALQYLEPLAHLTPHEITRRTVVTWFHQISHDADRSANNGLFVLKNLFNTLTDWEFFDKANPCDRQKLFPKVTRSRFIQSHEMPWLMKALGEERPQVETFFVCLLLTAARVGEAQEMRWADLDLGRALWHKPTTKNGKPHTVPLAPALVARLEALPRFCEWVFPSSPSGKNGFLRGKWSRTAIEVRWQRIRRRAGLQDVRIHDLRRTAASWMAIEGENLSVIAHTLNHSSLAVTQVYARLNIAPVRRALDAQAERILNPPLPPAAVALLPPPAAPPNTQTVIIDGTARLLRQVGSS